MRPLRIATMHADSGGSFLTRCQTPLTWLRSQNAIEVVQSSKAWEADVVLLHGQWWPGALAVMQSLQRHGIRVVVDVDEDIFSAPPEHQYAKTYREAAFQARVREIIEGADALLVPTDYLAARMSRFNPKTLVTPNGVDLSVWRKAVKPKRQERIRTIGFAGLGSHEGNLEILRPALAKLSGRFKENGIHFVSFGIRPTWLPGVLAGFEVVDLCSPEEYPRRLTRLGIDVALAPLTNAEFNKSRSALKFLEYSAAGAATVASDVGPFASAIQNDINGLLVDNHPESWRKAIWKLVRNDELRKAMSTAAREAAEAHDVSRTAPRMLEALEATEPNRERVTFAFPRTQEPQPANVDIVIPIYNAPALTRQAIESVLPELDEANRLILVDDCSSDPGVAAVLDDYEGRAWITVHRSAQNRGFVGTCNLAVLDLARPHADVILMNSDTKPMPGFIHRLADTANSNPRIGTVTAVSNNGSIASVPNVSDAARLAAELEHPLIIAPVGVGHLMYIKREAIRKHGFLDMAFSPGYGEEVDFCLRISKEYTHVIDTGCWCWHKGSASFRETVTKLKLDHQAMIDRRYPHFPFEVSAYHASDPLLDHRMRILSSTRDPRPRILHVAHSYEGGGGTEKHVQDLESALADQFLSCAAASHDMLKLYSGNILIARWPYVQPGWPLTTSEMPESDEVWLSLLNQLKPDLIHFHHALNHPLSLLAKLTSTGIPVIASVHDYYFLCPDFTLQHCPGLHECDTCFPDRFRGPADYQRLRRALLGGSLKRAERVVAPSQKTASLVQEVYPDLDVTVIPHGIRPIPVLERTSAAKIRFGLMGNIAPVKGIDIILKAWPIVSKMGGAELHLYGASDPAYIPRYSELGIHYHGPYRESDLPRILSEIDIGVLPSQAPETFCYALSEFFAGGIPVVGSDYGALSERIQDGVNGLKAPRDNPQAWADALCLLIQDSALRERVRQGVRPPVSISEMAARYATLYREIITKARGKSDLTSASQIPSRCIQDATHQELTSI